LRTVKPQLYKCSVRCGFCRATLCERGIIYAVVCLTVRPSVCPSVTSRYSIETTGRIELVVETGVPLTYATACYKESRVSPKITVLPFGTLLQTLDSEKFVAESRPRRQQNSSTVELVDHTCDARRAVAGRAMVYTTAHVVYTRRSTVIIITTIIIIAMTMFMVLLS